MSLNRYAKARDANEKDIVDTLMFHGISVYRLDRPLDLLLGFGDIDRLAEVKDVRNKRGDPKPYTRDQKKFLESWRGRKPALLITVDDARSLALEMRREARAA